MNYKSITEKMIKILLKYSFFFLLISCGVTKNKLNKNRGKIQVLNINFDENVLIRSKTKMTLYDSVKNKQVTYKGKIKRRGGFSISFPKHSYEIDLKQDVSLVSLPKDDDWILNANYIDKTFIRHVLSYELFSSMNSQNTVSKTKYIDLKINNQYNGLYVLMEKLDKSSLKLKKGDSTAIIFKEPHIFRKKYDGIIPQKPNNFHQQTYPKIEKEDKTVYLDNIRTFILTSSDDEFNNKISNIFNLENIIDWHLLLLISNNSDGILKNFYLYKTDSLSPFRIAPWDYDHSFGRDGDNELNIDKNPLDIKRSILFKRLLSYKWYKKALKQRWNELNKSKILSEEGLNNRIVRLSDYVKNNANKNFKIWPINGSPYYGSNNFNEEIEIMLKFIKLRHKRLRKYFEIL